MAHESTGMTGMENPSKRLGQVISWVDDPRDVGKEDGLEFLDPGLDGKHLDINVATPFCGDTVVDHVDG